MVSSRGRKMIVEEENKKVDEENKKHRGEGVRDDQLCVFVKELIGEDAPATLSEGWADGIGKFISFFFFFFFSFSFCCCFCFSFFFFVTFCFMILSVLCLVFTKF